jgi:hypothetical protein
MTQAVSRRLPTAAARIRAGSGHVGFVVDKVALGQIFSEYFGFHCNFPLHRLLQNPHLSSEADTISQTNIGRSTKWTQSHPVRKKKDSGEQTKGTVLRNVCTSVFYALGCTFSSNVCRCIDRRLHNNVKSIAAAI